MKYVHVAGLLAGLSVLGCDAVRNDRPASGDATELIFVMADSLWTGVSDSVKAAVAPRVFSVRNERTFEITQVSPVSELWLDLQRFKQVVAVGVPGDFWVDEVLGSGSPPASLPALVNADNVWARGQSVTAVVLRPDGDPVAALQSALSELGALLDGRFRQFARNRMFLSDTNTALRDSLAASAGYSITLPNIYQPVPSDGNLRAFHNRNEIGGDLFRTIAISWREGILTAADVTLVLAWRDSIVPFAYDLPQVTRVDQIQVRDLEDRAPGSIEVQGIWNGTDPTFPTAGPFIDRIVVCADQNRTYFLEAWMYGPGRQKYEYLIQFETILDSFRCGG